jgi:hypothetical protein
VGGGGDPALAQLERRFKVRHPQLQVDGRRRRAARLLLLAQAREMRVKNLREGRGVSD